MFFELSVDDLERLAQLAHLQADTVAESGDPEGARVPAALAERLEWAAAAGRKASVGTALMIV